MTLETLPPPQWINTVSALKKLADSLSGCSILAIDTESNGLHAYREQVCLIQCSDGQNDYLIDTLAIRDLSALAPIFASPKIEKIFHACEYDILCLKRDFGFSFSNIFDSMIASRILGFKSVGLGSILETFFNLKLDKRYQQANWGLRPLNPAMIEYARLDVHYLIRLRHQLKTQLEEKGRWPLAYEDFERLCQVQAKNEPFNSQEMVWRVAGQHELDPYQAAVLRALIEYRETYASKHNLPVHKVLSNQHLIEVAQASPHSLVDLAGNGDLAMSLIDRHGYALVDAVERGLMNEPLRRPCRQRPDPSYIYRLDTLREWRKNTAHILEVESDVILPRDLMEAIAAKKPNDLNGLKTIMHDIPWRFGAYGEQILNLLNVEVQAL